jgi:hypothetical protein
MKQIRPKMREYVVNVPDSLFLLFGELGQTKERALNDYFYKFVVHSKYYQLLGFCSVGNEKYLFIAEKLQNLKSKRNGTRR